MEKKNIFEKLGLVEKFETNIQADKNVEIVEKQGIEKTEKNSHEKEQYSKTLIKDEIKKEMKNSVVSDEEPIDTVKKKKLLKIEEIYKNYDIKTEGINSLTIIERFKRALPDYLPTDVKKESILNIITSSDVKVENLIIDGSNKLKCLNTFSETSNNELKMVVSELEKEINKLTEKISNYNTAIDYITKLHKEQDFIVKYEIERINDILQFINLENQNK